MNKERFSPMGKAKRDKLILYLYTYFIENRYAPTIREMGENVGITSTSVTRYYIDRLQIENMVIFTPKISRGTILSDKGLARARVLLNMDNPTVCSHCGAPVDKYGLYKDDHKKKPNKVSQFTRVN